MTELESPSQLSRVEAAKEAELASVPTATGSSPTPNSPLATSDPAPRAKNRFSLNALRLPFSSPRKQGNDKVSPSTDATSSSDSAAMTEQDANRSSTASDVTTAPTSIDQACWKDGTHSQQLSPRSQKNPVRSALTPPADLSRRRASRNVSPHRVSFSPSTEEMADAREQALLHASLADTASAKTKHVKSSSKRNDQHPSKSHTKLSNWHGLKSHSTSALTSTTNGSSLDSAQGSSATKRLEDAAALPGAAAAKRRLFRWDRKGIHHSGASGKGKVVKVKVTKTQAVAARHAKTLEQVINAGMGLHPVPPRLSSAAAADRSIASSDQPANVGKKSKVPRAKPIGVVHQSQLKGLKSALLDVDSANNIIKELRSMPVPLDVLRSGLGSMLSDVEIGTAGDHGQERILTANLPDSVLEGNITKDDSEIRKRPGATLEALDAATPARPPTERRAKSAAEEALRKITLQAEADSASPQKAVVTARTSSLPPSAEDNIAAPTKAASPIPSTSLPKAAAAPSGARPLKMVCLDCDETEAHRRHAQHLEASAVVTEKEASQSDSNGAFNVTSIATGAAAAVTSVGGLLTARPSAVDPTVSSAATDKDRDVSTRPPMLKSMSVSNLPTLQDGSRLMGATPLQLILDPVGTAAENSGAFNMLADVSGAAIRATQDMDSIHPPLDRMAIFVHWWGFEITLPKASMAYLDTAHSVSGAFLSFLQTMAVGGGVPELLPFIKYISTFMEVEYRAIRAQDQGHGVCIAGTWFMPMALVPRPWDYPLDGPVSEKLASRVTSPSASMPVPSIPAVSPVLTPPLATPSVAASPTRHVFKKKQATQTTPSAYPAQVALVEAPVRHVSPTQMAAIQAARTEKLPLDLSPRHSRSSSIASAKSAKLSAQLTSASDNAVAPQADAVLSSVQEVPEAGSQIKS